MKGFARAAGKTVRSEVHMKLTADYHTHTPYSHGKGTVDENAARAKALGLKQLGITDHGFAQLAFGLRRKKLPSLIADCRAASAKWGIDVLVGMEADILGENGETDMKPSDYDRFDLFVCGKHVLVAYASLRDWWHYFGGNFVADKFWRKPPRALVERNTRAYIAMIEKNPVDIVSHLGYLCPADAAEVAKCAADHGTYIELNSKKAHLTDEELDAVVRTGVRFVIDSDAHSADRVGDTKLVDEQLARVHVPAERIDNIDGRLPSFRFAEYKKHF